MGETVFVDLQVLAEVNDDEYLVRVSKEDLHSLVTFANELVVRHWDGNTPVELEPYGDGAVRTSEDASTDNNLVSLPRVSDDDLRRVLG